ncbi:ankyrin repeat-containing protein [Anaeramoeba ignava]|uniref:Ankyrin repeat-containing protein n=1 Tax=Anaeramoeba ignava TaxID=1746090 RepID=A0A9Q0L8A9_ANAIG|nr:ankyrin repeat-containing protein [Anaeramoeba ignava]
MQDSPQFFDTLINLINLKKKDSLEDFLKKINPNELNRHYEYFHQACLSNSIEIIETLLKYGANLNITSGATPLFQSCWYNCSPNVIDLLLKNNAQPNIETLDTPIHAACLGLYPEVVLKLIEAGCEIEKRNNCTPIHYASFFCNFDALKILIEHEADVNSLGGNLALHFVSSQVELNDLNSLKCVYLLIKSGADFLSKNNGLLPFDEIRDPKIKLRLNDYISIGYDFYDLLTQNLFDYEIRNIHQETIKFHENLVRTRVGNQNNFNTLIKLLKNMTQEEARSILKFLYCGILESRAKEKLQGVHFESDWIKKGRGRKGLLRTLEQLYQHEESKDFVIIAQDVPIRVHRFVLIARTGLYRQMFGSVEKEEKSVSDYSGRSPQAFQALIEYFYTDKISNNFPLSIVDELSDACDFFQLSNERRFNECLHGIEESAIFNSDVKRRRSYKKD